MSNRLHFSWSMVRTRSARVASQMKCDFPGHKAIRVCGVPRGGWFAALLIREASSEVEIELTSEALADAIVDDIIDSGATRNQWTCGGKPFYALVDKQAEGIHQFIVFPWETDDESIGPTENIRRLIQVIGDDPNREGLLETPSRVIRSYGELFGGYHQKPEDVIKVFEDGACDEMVIARGIEFVSFCEHHMLPFVGTAHIAYIPDGRVIGVSKLVRLLEIYARRLQIQERLCQQVTGALDNHLKPKGSACVLVAKHLCMSCRGVGKQQSEIITSSLTGVFRAEQATRQELFALIGGM